MNNTWFDTREQHAAELIDRALLMAKAMQKCGQHDRFSAYVAITNRLITYRLNLLDRL